MNRNGERRRDENGAIDVDVFEPVKGRLQEFRSRTGDACFVRVEVQEGMDGEEARGWMDEGEVDDATGLFETNEGWMWRKVHLWNDG